EVARQTSVLAVDALSVLRTGETWRPNPLIDDGKYHIASLQYTWDARNERLHPILSWYAHVQLNRVTSDELNPVSLPTTIRDGLANSGYGETDGAFDLRGSLRLDPDQQVSIRIAGAGYLSGDPLTVQRRVAIGDGDGLLAYGFRALNCD